MGEFKPLPNELSLGGLESDHSQRLFQRAAVTRPMVFEHSERALLVSFPIKRHEAVVWHASMSLRKFSTADGTVELVDANQRHRSLRHLVVEYSTRPNSRFP
jgi:hypothetical protein